MSLVMCKGGHNGSGYDYECYYGLDVTCQTVVQLQ